MPYVISIQFAIVLASACHQRQNDRLVLGGAHEYAMRCGDKQILLSMRHALRAKVCVYYPCSRSGRREVLNAIPASQSHMQVLDHRWLAIHLTSIIRILLWFYQPLVLHRTSWSRSRQSYLVSRIMMTMLTASSVLAHGRTRWNYESGI